MEKGFWAGLALLLVVTVASMAVETGMDRANSRTVALLEQAQAASDPAAAAQLLEQARQHWQRWREPMAGLSDHAPMEQIDVTFAGAAVWARQGKEAEFAAACAQLQRMIRAITEDRRLTWWNLLGICPILQ